MLAALADGDAAGQERRSPQAGACSAGVIDGLVDEGALEAVALPPEPAAAPLDPDFARPR